MGLCLSCCPRDSDRDSLGPDGDRSRLLNGEIAPASDGLNGRGHGDSDEENDEFPYGSLTDPNRLGSGIHFSSSVTKSKPTDEQSALTDIVHHMATNVIDVNMAHVAQTLEPLELQDRANEYSRQLRHVSAKLATKYAHLKAKTASEAFQDLASRETDSVVQCDGLLTNDRVLVKEVSARAREAESEFRVEPVQDLIGILGQIRDRFENEDESEDEEENEDKETDSNQIKDDPDAGSSYDNEDESDS